MEMISFLVLIQQVHEYPHCTCADLKIDKNVIAASLSTLPSGQLSASIKQEESTGCSSYKNDSNFGYSRSESNHSNAESKSELQ